MKPLVSVVIPTRNREKLLPKAIGSVLAQTFGGFELIVVDDGSADGTAGLVGHYGKRIEYIRQDRRGPGAARNRGAAAAGAELVAFLDSDDWWDVDKLKFQLAAMAENPACPISHTQETWFRRGELLPQKKIHRKPGGYIFPQCLSLCCVSASTVVIRKNLFQKMGGFDESLPCCEDYDLWLRISARHPFLLVDKPLTLKDGGRPDQVSFRHRVGIDQYRIRALLKIIRAPGFLSSEQKELALKELEKKCRIYGNGCLKHGKVAEGNFYLTLPKNLEL